MAMRIRLDRIKGLKVRGPRIKRTPFMDKVISILKWILHRVFVFIAFITALLGFSELAIHLIDRSSGLDNYVDWNTVVIVPFLVSGIAWLIVILLNLDRLKARFFKGRQKGADKRIMEPIDLD